MKNTELKQQLHDYIEAVDDKKLKAIYMVMEEDIKQYQDKWENIAFVEELERRSASIIDGNAKTYSWAEVKENGRKALGDKKAKNGA